MATSKRTQKLVMGLYAAAFTACTLKVALQGDRLLALALGAVTIAPALLFLAGVLGARYVMAAALLFLLPLWALLPIPLHSVDRTPVFWLVWILLGGVLLAGAIVPFLETSKRPE